MLDVAFLQTISQLYATSSLHSDICQIKDSYRFEDGLQTVNVSTDVVVS